MGHSPIPSPPYGDKEPLSMVPQKRVISSPDDEIDPHIKACFPIIHDENSTRCPPCWEPIPIKLIKKT